LTGLAAVGTWQKWDEVREIARLARLGELGLAISPVVHEP